MKNTNKINQKLKLQEIRKSKLSKITFYLLRDFENTTSLSDKMKLSERNISYYTGKFNLFDECDSIKVPAKTGKRNTSNRYHKHKKGKITPKIKSYRLRIEYLLTPFYGEKRINNLQGRSQKIMQVLLEPKFIRENIFNDISKVNRIEDIRDKIYEFIENFIWNFQDDVLNRGVFYQSADFDKEINKDNCEISKNILNSIKEPENSIYLYRGKFYDIKFLVDIITNFCSRAHIELLYDDFSKKIRKHDKEKIAFHHKVKLFLNELYKTYNWGNIPVNTVSNSKNN